MSSVPSYGAWVPPFGEPPGGGDDGWRAALGAVDGRPCAGVAFLFALMGAIFVGIVGAIFGASFTDPPPAVNIVATVVQDGAFIGAALMFAARAGRVCRRSSASCARGC